MGFFWGALVSPLWNEMVEFGLALSGTVRAYIPFFVSDYSVQITLPALMFKFGIGSLVVAILSSGICVALAFSAASAVSLVLSRSAACALMAPVILCKYPFYNFHYYPIKFPIYNYIFGQVGFYAAVLAISLLALGHRRGAFLLAGLMAGIHLPWALGVFLFFGVYLLIERRWRSINSAAWRNFTIGITISLLAGIYHVLVLEPGFLEQQVNLRKVTPVLDSDYADLAGFLIASETVVAEAGSGDSSMSEEGVLDETFSADDIFLDRRLSFASNRGSHNLLFRDSPAPLLEGAKFFFIDILLFACLLYLLRRPQPGLDASGTLASFIKALFCFQLLVVLYKLLDELDPQWRMFGMIHESLPGLLLRVIPNRWMNVDALVFPLVFLAILFGYLENRRNIPAFLGLLTMVMIPWLPETDGHNYEFSALLSMLKFQLGGFTLAFMVTSLLVLIPGLQRWNLQEKGWNVSGRLTWAIMTYYLASLIYLGIFGFLSEDYLRRKDAGIALAAAKGTGPVLPAFGVQGYGDFNIFAQLGRPYYLPGALLLPVPGTDLELDVFCATDSGNSVQEKRLYQAQCFADRHPRTWRYIGEYLEVGEVITRSDVAPNLALTGRSPDFHIYEIE